MSRANSLFLIILIFLTACGTSEKQKEHAKKIYFDHVVINVLDKALYDDCHIPLSINVSLDELGDFAALVDPQCKVVVYCSNYACTASAYAARQLQQKGIMHVYAYEGGMAEWYQAHLPVEGSARQDYLTLVMERDEVSDQYVTSITKEDLASLLGIRSHESGTAA